MTEKEQLELVSKLRALAAEGTFFVVIRENDAQPETGARTAFRVTPAAQDERYARCRNSSDAGKLNQPPSSGIGGTPAPEESRLLGLRLRRGVLLSASLPSNLCYAFRP
jgi:hypothetical protein